MNYKFKFFNLQNQFTSSSILRGKQKLYELTPRRVCNDALIKNSRLESSNKMWPISRQPATTSEMLKVPSR